MSKALVINGANFTVNKVETITIGEAVPCTGIELSDSTHAFTAIGATFTLTPTLTPSNTTDAVSWVSSNENVATVLNGVVTCTGVGSATITAVCGSYSDTCELTSTLTVDADVAYTVENGAYISGTELPTKDHVGRSENARGRLYYSNEEFGTYRVFALTTNAGKYAIPIPNNTSKITITPPTGMTSMTRLALVDVNSKQTYVTGNDGNSVKAVAYFDLPWNASYPYEINISSYTDANGFTFSVYAPSGTDASTVTAHSTLVFS